MSRPLSFASVALLLLASACSHELVLGWDVSLEADYPDDLCADEDRVYLTVRDPYTAQGSVRALDARSGEELWRVAGAPVQLMLHEGRLFTVEDHSTLLALDPATGEELWRAFGYDLFMFAGAPGGDVYVARSDEGWAPLLNRIAGEGANVWQVQAPHTLQWIAAGSDGTVYGFGEAGEGGYRVSAFEPDDGALRFTVDYPDAHDGSPAVGADAIYLGGSALRALSTEDGATLWEAGVGSLAEPAIDEQGRLYVPTQDGVVALEADGTQRWQGEASGASTPALGRNGTLVTTARDMEGDARPRVFDMETGEILQRTEEGAGCAKDSFLYGVGAWDSGPLLAGGRMFQTSGAWNGVVCAWEGAPSPAEGPWVRAGGGPGSARLAGESH